MNFIERFTKQWKKYRKPGYYDEFDYAWTMTIDLDSCTGCGACVTACQAENNIPIVGEKELAKGREMQWIRIERYWQGEYPNARLSFIPMLCQQCDAAPCETVCPVSATYHNQDGLNTQIYNRCIGTRSCAVYCPYEVRYFNYNNHHWDTPLDQQLNPDVTVREKGVMEKCTFCIQRIRQAKDHAKDDGRRRVKDSDMQPACVQTCPTEALVFGNRLDKQSRVQKTLNSPRAYRVLDELNTQPSVVYLKKVSTKVDGNG
jgi:molybdopterin-containing oxidoreductase family iron-sulfur binding subunit